MQKKPKSHITEKLLKNDTKKSLKITKNTERNHAILKSQNRLRQFENLFALEHDCQLCFQRLCFFRFLTTIRGEQRDSPKSHHCRFLKRILKKKENPLRFVSLVSNRECNNTSEQKDSPSICFYRFLKRMRQYIENKRTPLTPTPRC